MPDVARDPAALELLREQRSRLADRMRPPWWYLTGAAIMWALAFASPFGSRFGLPQGIRNWPILVPILVLACLLQWGLTRTTGLRVGYRDLGSPPAGRPGRIMVFVVCLAALVSERFLIDRGLVVAAIVVAALAVAAEMALLQAQLRGIRQELRGGGGAA